MPLKEKIRKVLVEWGMNIPVRLAVAEAAERELHFIHREELLFLSQSSIREREQDSKKCMDFIEAFR